MLKRAYGSQTWSRVTLFGQLPYILADGFPNHFHPDASQPSHFVFLLFQTRSRICDRDILEQIVWFVRWTNSEKKSHHLPKKRIAIVKIQYKIQRWTLETTTWNSVSIIFLLFSVFSLCVGAELDLKFPVTRILIGCLIADQLRFLENWPPTPLLGKTLL